MVRLLPLPYAGGGVVGRNYGLSRRCREGGGWEKITQKGGGGRVSPKLKSTFYPLRIQLSNNALILFLLRLKFLMQ
jgi:hypothetical protein